MEDHIITVPMQKYERLVALEAKVGSLMAYVNRTKYSVDRGLIGGILGFCVNEVKDGNCGKPDGE